MEFKNSLYVDRKVSFLCLYTCHVYPNEIEVLFQCFDYKGNPSHTTYYRSRCTGSVFAE